MNYKYIDFWLDTKFILNSIISEYTEKYILQNIKHETIKQTGI